jgi:hypothetical protein
VCRKSSLTIVANLVEIGAASQPWIFAGEKSLLLTHIAAMLNASSFAPMKSSPLLWNSNQRFALSANLLDTRNRFFPNSTSLSGSESGGGHSPARFLVSFQTRKRIKTGGEEERKNHESIDSFKRKNRNVSCRPGLLCDLPPVAQAVNAPPDGGYPGQNTAEGDDALFSLTTGTGNTAIGFQALFGTLTGKATRPSVLRRFTLT